MYESNVTTKCAQVKTFLKWSETGKIKVTQYLQQKKKKKKKKKKKILCT
jgi:hypothetical protein